MLSAIKSLSPTTKSIVTIMIFTILGQIISLVKESIFAAYLSLSIDADIFLLATQIPTTIFATITVGVTTIVLPIYVEKYENRGSESANLFVSNMIILFGILSICFSFLGFIFSADIIHIIAPSYSGDVLDRTVEITRVSFISLIFITLYNVIKALLNANKSFVVPILISYLQNIFVGLAIVLFYEKYGLISMIYALLISYIIEFILASFFSKSIFHFRPNWKIKDYELSSIIKIFVPVFIGVGIAELNKLVDRYFASGLQEGSIAALNYSTKIISLFTGLITVAFSTVIFQKIATLYFNEEKNEVNSNLNKFLSVILIITVPITVGLIILSNDLVTILFMRGNFGLSEMTITASILLLYSISIPFVVLRDIFTKSFYAVKETKYPMIVSSLGMIINIVLNFIFVKTYGVYSLVFSSVFSSVFVVIGLYLLSFKTLKINSYSKLYKTLFKVILMSSSMFIILKLIPNLSNPYTNILYKGVIGFVFYILIGLLVKLEVLLQYIKLFFNKSRRKL